jgi:hypothetical protein
MYRQGLGDCFLLTFEPDDHLLIDCGVLAGTPGGAEKIKEIAEDIRKETGGHLRALVVTHEHWDHVSGFVDARDVFEKMTIDETWVAWTEDPRQRLIKERRQAMAVRLPAIRGAVDRLGRSGDPQDTMLAAEIAEVLEFSGGLGAFSEKTDEAMDWVVQSAKELTYWSPGDLIERSWLGDVKIHVLGPPRDVKALKKSEGAVGTDMYGMTLAATGEDLGFALAVSGETSGSSWLPFDQALQSPDELAWLKRFGPAFRKSYREERWRRIDSDWLRAAATLSLQLDNAINNTSLVLALERGNGDVLLFVADAQVGNWKSWVTEASDLLARTVFYKVGHHGSHNGTLKDGGLEAMTSENLVAAIPVNEVMAKAKRPHPWLMPADRLYEALQQRTRGRILRSDVPAPSGGDPAPAGTNAAEWKAFTSRIRGTELFTDLRIE